jgi:exonuclease-1
MGIQGILCVVVSPRPLLINVTGLLPLLKSIQKPTELKKFAGETLGVDAYGWLHRGAIACAIDLAQGRPTRK